jgi:hypothetical protein
LNCSNTRLTKLSLREDPSLSILNVLNVVTLTDLYCGYNKLAALDLLSNTVLTSLLCSETNITTLDLSKNIFLEYLFCSNNKLTDLNLSQNTKLFQLDCRDNQITSLDLSYNRELGDLHCENNLIHSLDLSQNDYTGALDLYCDSNRLTSLNLKSDRYGTGNVSYFLSALNNPDLTCIMVGNVDKAVSDYLWHIDEIASYSLFCESLGVDQSVLLDNMHCYPNPTNDFLTVELNGSGDKVTFSIYDLIGKLVSKQEGQGLLNKVNVSGLVQGVYLLKIDTDNGSYSAKFVKN